MTRGMLKAVIILPGTAIIYVPGLVIWLTRNTSYAASWSQNTILGWLAGFSFAAVGLALMIWTMRLFMTKGGGGTPAPWEPIKNLIIEGPYRYLRNPMLSGVILFLIAEALILQSVPVLLWALFFLALNTVYFALSEEPQLEKRYGTPYVEYKKNVPRWLPRLSPYQLDNAE